MLGFEFNGYSSDEFGIIVTSIEENDQLESRSLILGQKNKFRARENHFGATYDQNYTFNIVILKNPCRKTILPHLELFSRDPMLVSDIENMTVDQLQERIVSDLDPADNVLVYDELFQNMTIENGLLKFPNNNYDINLTNGILTSGSEDYFTSNDIRALNAWLTSPQFPKKLKFTGNEYFKEDIEFFVTFTSVSTENVGNPFKLIYTVTCDSPYAYSPIQEDKITTNTFESTGIKNNDEKKIHYLYNMTDCRNEYVYPVLRIKPAVANKPISICNLNADPTKELKITPKNTDAIYMDCQHLKVYKLDENGNEIQITFSEDLGIKDPNDILKIYWPRLVYGCNSIWTDGLAFITIQWREPRKVGAFA